MNKVLFYIIITMTMAKMMMMIKMMKLEIFFQA